MLFSKEAFYKKNSRQKKKKFNMSRFVGAKLYRNMEKSRKQFPAEEFGFQQVSYAQLRGRFNNK